MNPVQRTALLNLRNKIVDSVDFNYIKEKLVAYGILNHEELEEIDYEVNRAFVRLGVSSSSNVVALLLFPLSENPSGQDSQTPRPPAQEGPPFVLQVRPNARGKETSRVANFLFTRIESSLPQADYDWLAELLGKFQDPDTPDAASTDPAANSQQRDSSAVSDSLSAILQASLITGGIPFPPPCLIRRSDKVGPHIAPRMIEFN